jgi:hypothetical protein
MAGTASAKANNSAVSLAVLEEVWLLLHNDKATPENWSSKGARRSPAWLSPSLLVFEKLFSHLHLHAFLPDPGARRAGPNRFVGAVVS